MAQFWKLDAKTWINPAYIVQVEDSSTVARSILYVTLASGLGGEYRGSGLEKWVLDVEGEARETLLAYLARETDPAPPPAPA